MPVERCKHEENNKEEMDQLGNRVMVREGDAQAFLHGFRFWTYILRPPESFFYISYISFMDVS
jgi:hypothetical protein